MIWSSPFTLPLFLIVVFTYCLPKTVLAQEVKDSVPLSQLPPDMFKKKAGDDIIDEYVPLVLKLTEDGQKYIRFLTWHQVQVNSHNFNDPGASSGADFMLRRSRALMYAQISPKFLVLTHFGLNSLTPQNMNATGVESNAPQLFMHDAYGEFHIADFLRAGLGLHYHRGLTRKNSQSTLNFLTLDHSRPFAHWHSLGVTDQFARHLGVYFTGDVGRLEYRVSFNNPIVPENSLGGGNHFGNVTSDLSYTGLTHDQSANYVIDGYFKYDLLDKETMNLPYYVGTYLGQKKILSIGTGFYSHPGGMYNEVTGENGNVFHYASDLFFDHPVKGGAVNMYASYQNFNYGEGYMSRWAGTGHHYYAHAGYLYRALNIMPYVGYQIGDFEGLIETPRAFNAGVNYFLNGHHAKFTLEYHHIGQNILEGPVTAEGAPLGVSQIRFQMHVFL